MFSKILILVSIVFFITSIYSKDFNIGVVVGSHYDISSIDNTDEDKTDFNLFDQNYGLIVGAFLSYKIVSLQFVSYPGNSYDLEVNGFYKNLLIKSIYEYHSVKTLDKDEFDDSSGGPGWEKSDEGKTFNGISRTFKEIQVGYLFTSELWGGQSFHLKLCF